MPHAGSSLPLVHGFRHGDALARDADRIIRVEDFLGAARAVRDLLPATHYVINLCEDRYWFAVAFAATLLRGATNLLPHNSAPATLAQLRRDYPDSFIVSDRASDDTLNIAATDTAASTLEVPTVPAEHIAALVFTSGSTGIPKPNAKTWRSMVEIARRTARRFDLETSRATLVATVPQQHMYGLETSILMPLQHGMSFARGRPFFPEDVRVALDAAPAPRVLITTPVHLRALVAESIPWPDVKLIISATAPLPRELAAQSEFSLRAPVHEIYGWSEAGSVATRRTVDNAAWHVFDDARIARGERVALQAPWYAHPVPFEDVIEAASDTEFMLVGRSQDMVNIAGKRASLGDLNTRLAALPGVRDAAFYLPPEDGAGVTRLAAFVVAPDASAESLLTQLRTAIDAVFLPRPLIFVASLPRNATGKLTRTALDTLWREYRAS